MDFRVRNTYTFRYRIVVYDEKRKVWVVKKSGVTKKEGLKIVQDYFQKNITARLKIND